MNNYRLELCYDGTRYNGWQKLGSTGNTIQNKIETVLSRILEQPVEVSASGRTDAGVHAKMQVCSFKTDSEKSCEEILEELRKYLPADIGAINLLPAEPGFHARYNCTGKKYIYRIWTSPLPNVFERNYVYTYTDQLNVEDMRKAAEMLCGKHDFSGFTSLKKSKKSTVRTIREIAIDEYPEEIRITACGDGFLYNMVRIIVGTLIEIGNGKRPPDSIEEMLNSGVRANAGFTAPAKGLCLAEIYY
ncbi:MAG: tRNA pseudouridine(38-40) synthase TruA [Eubacteriales bacterium]|nr:tRNA pseudouridine(38-40) synthase TruA [Eubacteriales bacterium]